jgi:hypothetical protein
MKGFPRFTRLHLQVTTVELCISLLKDEHPYFWTLAFGENWNRVLFGVAWETVINNNVLPLPLNAYLYTISPFWDNCF